MDQSCHTIWGHFMLLIPPFQQFMIWYQPCTYSFAHNCNASWIIKHFHSPRKLYFFHCSWSSNLQEGQDCSGLPTQAWKYTAPLRKTAASVNLPMSQGFHEWGEREAAAYLDTYWASGHACWRTCGSPEAVLGFAVVLRRPPLISAIIKIVTFG